MKPSRRAVLGGLGSALLAAFAPAPVQVSLSRPLRSLEEIIGPERLARAHYLWTRRGWLWSGGHTMLDEHGRLNMAPGFRVAFTAIMNGCEAAEFVHADYDYEGIEEYNRNQTVLAVFSQFGLLPPDVGYGHFGACCTEERRDALTVSDSWKRMGWPEPQRIAQRAWQPDPEWMMTGKVSRHTHCLLPFIRLDKEEDELEGGNAGPRPIGLYQLE